MATNAESLYLKCGLLNVQSTGNKTFEIRDLINDSNMDVLVITETWMTVMDNAKIREMTPVTHKFLHNPRKTGRGGGVGIFLNESFKKINCDVSFIGNNFEHLKVTCELQGRKFIFVVVYRPPSGSATYSIQCGVSGLHGDDRLGRCKCSYMW